MTGDDFLFAFCTTASILIIGEIGYAVGSQIDATMDERCDIACGSSEHDYTDLTHICTCDSGAVYHIRSVVETVREAPEGDDR